MEIYEILAISLLAVFIIVLIVKMILEKEFNVKEWLLCAVTVAEKEFGAGTGSEKLKAVYGKFTEYFPVFSLFISLETFSRWVDIALDYMKEALTNGENKNGT